MSKFIQSANDDHLIMVTAQPQKGWIRPAANTFMIMIFIIEYSCNGTNNMQVWNKYQYSMDWTLRRAVHAL